MIHGNVTADGTTQDGDVVAVSWQTEDKLNGVIRDVLANQIDGKKGKMSRAARMSSKTLLCLSFLLLVKI